MEQQQLKKGLAKQFIFRSDQIVNQTLDYFFTEFKNYNFSNRSWKKVNSYFESTKKFALHKTEFGTRKNPCFGITFLVASKYNDEKEWDEENLFSSIIHFSKNPFDFDTSYAGGFEISMHAFERIFERHANKNMKEFDIAYEVIKEELKYLCVFSIVIQSYFKFLDNEDKNLFYNNNYYIIPVPSKNGLFICHLHKNSLCVRTYLSSNQINSDQQDISHIFLDSFEPYVTCHLPYLSKLATNRASNILIKIEVAILMSSILLDMKPYFNKIIPYSFIDNIPKSRANKLNKFFTNRIDQFIEKVEPYKDITKNFNKEIRSYGKDGKIPELMRKLKIIIANKQGNIFN